MSRHRRTAVGTEAHCGRGVRGGCTREDKKRGRCLGRRARGQRECEGIERQLHVCGRQARCLLRPTGRRTQMRRELDGGVEAHRLHPNDRLQTGPPIADRMIGAAGKASSDLVPLVPELCDPLDDNIVLRASPGGTLLLLSCRTLRRRSSRFAARPTAASFSAAARPGTVLRDATAAATATASSRRGAARYATALLAHGCCRSLSGGRGASVAVVAATAESRVALASPVAITLGVTAIAGSGTRGATLARTAEAVRAYAARFRRLTAAARVVALSLAVG
mmetsp:Transcript_40241/g.106566  ORF Transcript_40241/g.106566 Transcript_40241/m.106566 type:complete len:279 (+) Transcript_40241:613-1449(+)